jgi:hypothetical protein
MKNIITFTLLLFLIFTKVFSQPSGMRLNDKAYSILNSQSISYPFSFIVMGDTRPGRDNNNDELSEDWIEIMNQIKPTNFLNNYEFIIILGDMMKNGTLSEYIKFYEYTISYMNSIGVPVISVPGNHDLNSVGSYARFNAYVGNYDYYFDILDWRFLYVNNTFQQDGSDNKDYPLEITTSQMNWVKNVALSQTTNCPDNVISFAHLPFFRIWGGRPTISFPNYQNYFDALIAKDCRVHYGAHFHDYMRQFDCSSDLLNITTGGGGAELYSYSDNPNPPFVKKFHFLYVTIYADGSLKTEVYFKGVGHNTEASKGDFWVHGQSYANNLSVTGYDTGVKNYFAKNTITVAGNGKTYTAYSNSNVKMVVDKGGFIELSSGFEIKLGASFEINIQDFECENLSE